MVKRVPAPTGTIGEWCNGSTTDSGSVSPGSNPGSPVIGAAGRATASEWSETFSAEFARKGLRKRAAAVKVIADTNQTGYQTSGRTASEHVFPPARPDRRPNFLRSSEVSREVPWRLEPPRRQERQGCKGHRFICPRASSAHRSHGDLAVCRYSRSAWRSWRLGGFHSSPEFPDEPLFTPLRRGSQRNKRLFRANPAGGVRPSAVGCSARMAFTDKCGVVTSAV